MGRHHLRADNHASSLNYTTFFWRSIVSGKGSWLSHIQNIGRWNYTSLANRRDSIFLLGFYVLISFPSLHCIRYELRAPFYGQEINLTQAHYHHISTGWGVISTIFKVIGVTRTRTRDLPTQIQVCYYWAKSAG